MKQKSLVVLPFTNISPQAEDQYFSDGLSEELINVLSGLEGLKLIARTSAFSLKNTDLGIKEIGELLKVAYVLEGSVQKAGNRIRVRLKLIAVDDGFSLWSEFYDRELKDVFELQDEIAAHVLESLEIYFQQNFSSSHYTTNPLAYEAFLKGHYYFKRDYEGTLKALDLFKEAYRIDPNYAEAYAYAGECYIHHAAFGLISSAKGHEEARRLAEIALGINAYEAHAWKLLTFIYLFYDWNWEAARDAYQKALKYGLSEFNEFVSYYHIFLNGDYQEAISIAHRALQNDPLHAEAHWQLGLCYYFAQNFKEALKVFDHALTLDGRYSEAHRWKAVCLSKLERFSEAEISMQKALELSGEDPWQNFYSLMLKIKAGDSVPVAKALRQNHYLDSADPAQLYTLLEDNTKALDYLEKAFTERSVMMVSIKHYWVWNPLRKEARFQQLLEKMNFPEKSWSELKRLKPEPPKLDEEVKQVLEYLDRLMSVEELYLDPGLNLSVLAKYIKVHPNKLSWLINEHKGQNFNEFINSYRLESFKKKALDPQNQKLTLLALAYDSGFNSKSVFNEFFKKSTGLSPRAWLKSHT